MKQEVNTVYQPLFKEKARYYILMGGRGAGRSTVSSQYANARLVDEGYFRCAIMRYVLGDIRNSIYREITDRAEENGVLGQFDVNESMMTISYGANSINAVGFKKSSSDQKAKLKSLANYNCVIIEEADEIPEADFMQLDDSLRTMKGDIKIILLLNPPAKSHWIVQRFFDLSPSEITGFYVPVLKSGLKDTIIINSSFEDNLANIAEQSIANYREYEHSKPSHYWNMIRGLVPEVVKGKIYSGWETIDELPHGARLERYGLDFGYTNDPTAIVAIYYYNGGYILDEVVYKQGMLNREIANTINSREVSALTIADSAEPKSIDEIRLMGVNILPAIKGPGSITKGIDLVKDKKIKVTRRSVNILTEYDNYAWFEDKDGKILNEPKPGYDHAMDAIRYAFNSMNFSTTQAKQYVPNHVGGARRGYTNPQ